MYEDYDICQELTEDDCNSPFLEERQMFREFCPERCGVCSEYCLCKIDLICKHIFGTLMIMSELKKNMNNIYRFNKGNYTSRPIGQCLQKETRIDNIFSRGRSKLLNMCLIPIVIYFD